MHIRCGRGPGNQSRIQLYYRVSFQYYIKRDRKYKTVLKHHNNVTINGYTRYIVARGVEVGVGGKACFDVHADT